MLLKRVLTALILLPALLAALIPGEVPGTAAVVALLALGGVHEFLRFRNKIFLRGEESVIAAWGGLVAFSFISKSLVVPGALLTTGLLIYLMYDANRRDPGPTALARFAHVAASWLYIAFGLGFAVTLRRFGYEPIIFLVVIVMAGDTAAFFVGSAIGRVRLAPRISPKKSVEGAVASIIGACVCGGLLAGYLKLPFGPTAGVLISAVLNIAAQAGDLAESFLKRAAGVKDSGKIFPGHGGVLDRVDAFLPTLPLFAAILMLTGGQP